MAEFSHGNHALRPESSVKPCVSPDNMFIRSNLSGKMVLFTEKVRFEQLVRKTALFSGRIRRLGASKVRMMKKDGDEKSDNSSSLPL